MSGSTGNGHVTRSAVALGQTRTKTVHITAPTGELQLVTVFDTIDAGTDPDVAARLLGIGAPLGGYTDANGNTATVQTSILYHDAKAELFVLVLSPHERHRELRERIALLERLDGEDGPVPRYIKDFVVVFGGEELAKLVERRRERTTVPPPMIAITELETTAAELAAEARSLDVLREAIAAREELVAQSLADIDARIKDLDRREIAFARQMAGEVAPSRQVRETQLRVRPPSDSPLPDADFDEYKRLIDSDESIVDAALDALLPLPGFASDENDPETNARSASSIEQEESTGAFPFPSISQAHLTIPSVPSIVTLRVLDVAAIAEDEWLAEFAAASNPSRIAVVDDTVRLVVRINAGDSIDLHGALDLRITLQRLDAYPVVTMLLGSPDAIASGDRSRCFVVPIDIADDNDRAVLAQLSRDVSFVLDIIDVSANRELSAARRCYLAAPLAENVGFIMHAADDHLRGLQAAPDGSADFLRGVEQLAATDFDLFGTGHVEHGEFRDAKLTQLDTANHVRRALAIAARFSKPAREDYLVCVRGVPLSEWRAARRHVLRQAVEWGLWMGADLAQVAVSEGFAHSRRDLVMKMLAGFAELRQSGAHAFDLEDDVADDNLRALLDEAAQLRTSNPAIEVVDVAGDHPSLPVESEPAARSSSADSGVHLMASIVAAGVSGPIVVSPSESRTSESSDGAAAGSIDRPRFSAAVAVRKDLEQLLADLDLRSERMNAAVALCELADPRAIDPIMSVVTKMSRSEAVRVLGMMVRFGTAAESSLRLALSSTKGFIRHGSALALALLRTDNGANDVIELLLREPTEIWREIARAIGQIGPAALMPLASQLGRLGDAASASARERVSWAMAHVGVRGGKPAIEALSNGVGVVAPVAQHALTLMQAAARDEVRVGGSAGKGGGTNPGREVTVNRAFSKRFFEALEQGLPDVGQAELEAMDASESMEMLDEGDLIDEDSPEAPEVSVQAVSQQDDANELDDGDLLPA